MPARRGEPRVAAAEAEADREDRRAATARRGAEVLDRGADVLLDAVGRRLRDVIHVREVVVALGDAGGAPEVVEGDGGIAALAEAQRELLVEAVEAADVREHDDADRAGLVREGGEGGEARCRRPPRA